MPEGGYGHLCFWEKPKLPHRASTLKICVILSGALCAESNLEGMHREAWRHLLPSRDLAGSPPKPSGDTPRE